MRHDVSRELAPNLSVERNAVAQFEMALYQRKVGAAFRANGAGAEMILRFVGTCLDHTSIDNRERDLDGIALFRRIAIAECCGLAHDKCIE